MISYEKKDTPIHKLSGFTKLVFFLLWCFCSALTFDTRILIVMLLLGAVIYAISGTKLKQVSSVFYAVMFFMVINLTCIFFFAPYQGCDIYGTRHDICHLFGNYFLTREQLFYEFNVFIKYFTVIPYSKVEWFKGGNSQKVAQCRSQYQVTREEAFAQLPALQKKNGYMAGKYRLNG